MEAATFVERDRLRALIDYVEATERDRFHVALDVADHRGFRRFRDELVRLPGVQLDRGGGDAAWLAVERLVRSAPPVPDDDALRLWTEVSADPAVRPALRPEVPRAGVEALGIAVPDDAGPLVRLTGFDGRAGLEAALAAWVRERWNPWAEEEAPRRRTIALYNALFALRDALGGASEAPVELVWGIGVAHWFRSPARLRYPLLTRPVELSLDADTHALLVRPRTEALPGIEVDALDQFGAAGLNEWRSATEALLAAPEAEELTPFDPGSFGGVLRRAAALLDPDACYLPDLGEHAAPGEDVLRIDDGWVLFERPRRASQLMDDLRRLRGRIDQLGDADAIPPAVRVLLQPPADVADAPVHQPMRGVSTIPGVTSADGSGSDLFFPLPFNREQVEVVQRLAHRPGVVVQGPPGTGKTHTIANIVSHYLALGKRVLVTSQKTPALKVLRDKLPEAVRPLAVSLLDSDRDGLKQFQESVDVIADRVQRTRIGEAREQIAALDAQIDAIHRALAAIDREVETIGREAMHPVAIDGGTLEPAAAARQLVAAGPLARWLDDPIDAIRSHDPAFDDAMVATLREARKAAGRRLAALDQRLPPADLTDPGGLRALHDMLVEADALHRATAPDAALRGDADRPAIDALLARLDALADLRGRIAAQPLAWSDAIAARLRVDRDDPAAAAMAGLAAEVDAAVAEARHFLVRPVELPDGAAEDPGFREGVGVLARGGELGLFHALFARATRTRIAGVRLAARAPAGAEEWAEVARYLAARDAADRLRAIWNHAADHAGIDPVAAEGLAGADAMRRALAQLAALRAQVDAEEAIDAGARQLLPGWRHAASGSADRLREVLAQHGRRLALAEARRELEALRARVAGVPGAIGHELRAVLALVGAEATDPAALDTRWSAALEEAGRLRALQPAFATIRDVTGRIEESGGVRWAARLRAEPVEGVEDPLTPGDWRNRWTLRRLTTWLDRIDRHGRLRTLAADRREAEERLRRAYGEAIETRTWCRLAEQATDQVRGALAAYGQAMRRLGRGTGVRAGRYRADARAAADRAKNALPCWIMPHYRVSESLPPDLGLFDLVIVDEASQSTVAALPALLRARQVLVVGDDRQVSPDAGFREEARLALLAERHLAGQVGDFRAAMREDQSLFDLSKVVFAGGELMLKEHFRCVAPVIEYSKAQFYSHQLVPLRLPSASERLDPPLVDILVEDGHRRGKTNPPEIDCIVDEIARIAADPLMAERTVGVTTLLGQEQAVAIGKALEEGIGTEAMLRHQVRVGEPAAFQGDERDIMFLSLVADRNSRPVSGLGQEQRFNVAASRARDRMVLVRSVELEELSPADKLRRSLIEHFQAPFPGEGTEVADRRARCESGFEGAMFDLLVARGYRVDTQVRVGSRRIDLVVEGAEDRRLGIECDGDAFHGPDRWPDDMARQRMLERAGWTIWRCFASRFVRDTDGVIAELVGVLDARGIAPERGEEQGPSRHTQHRRWRSTPLADADAEPVPHAWLVCADPF